MFIRFAVPLALVVLLGYGLVEAYPVLAGPRIVLVSPEDGARVAGGVLTVAGTAYRIQDLSFDGGVLLMDERGAFSTTVALPAGDDILSLTGRDRFGRTTGVLRRVVVPAFPSAATSSVSITTNP